MAGPWQRFLIPPEQAALLAAVTLVSVGAACNPDVQRIRVRKPGNIDRVDPARACRMLEPEEDLGFRPCAPDVFEGGIGKNYGGFRLAFVEGEGFLRIENNGSETPAKPDEVAWFVRDLSNAATDDAGIKAQLFSLGLDRMV